MCCSRPGRLCLLVFVFGAFHVTNPVASQDAPFIRGDGNGDLTVDISDGIFALSYLFEGTVEPTCLDALDANDLTGLDLSDPVYLFNFLFLGGPPMPAPYPDCGVDPTEDETDCASYVGCVRELDPAEQVQLVRESENGPVEIEVPGIVVTYVREAVGRDSGGFFAQAGSTGPAIFVVTPDDGAGAVAVGDTINLTATEVDDQFGDTRSIITYTGLEVVESGLDVSTIAQDVSDAADLVDNLDAYESELLSISCTLVGGFSGAGTGHSSSSIDTVALDGANIKIRMPNTLLETLSSSNNFVAGCELEIQGPMWRFFDQAQPSVYAEADIAVVSCPEPPKPVVTGAVATSETTVDVSFDLEIDASSVVADGSQFTFSPEVATSGATVSGNVVTVTTSALTPSTEYTVTVAGTVEGPLGAGVDPASNSATFTSLGSGLSIASTSYSVIAHGASFEINGNGFSDVDEITLGGEPVDFTVNSTTSISVQDVSDATPTGAVNLVVTTGSGSTDPFEVTVIHLVINETDADQTGTDATEFVEVSAGLAGVDLSGYVIVLYNGSDDLSYASVDLNGTTNADGLLVVGSGALTPAADVLWAGPDNQLQNGADAVALVQGVAGDFGNDSPIPTVGLLDAVVYGTSDGDDVALITGLLGAGGAQIDENLNMLKDTQSIQRCSPARLDASAFVVVEPTPGAANACGQ